jgi:hypothetical protein
MSTPGRNRKPSAAAALALLATLVPGVQPARAGTAEPSPGAPREAIKVHGDWTIEVKNPDGSLVSHHEFANALDSSGGVALAQMLARTKVAGEWGVSLWQVGSGLRPPCPSSSDGACFIGEVGGENPGAPFKTLTVSVPPTGPNAGKLVLSGQATAEADGDIARVSTLVGLCAGTTAPASCTNYRSTVFTAHNFPTPIVVLANQIVQVTVVISFS